MGVRSLVAALLVLALAPAANAAGDAWTKTAKQAHLALARSVEAGYLTTQDEAHYLSIMRNARAVRDRVPPLRAQLLRNVLVQIAARKSPTGPRARDLYTTLQVNAEYLATHRVPADGTDVTASDGGVYRFFAGKGLQFHPLANASRLNSLVSAGDTEGAMALVEALAGRAMPEPGGAIAWEYQFDYGHVLAPWQSGMAQAVMAQALARAGETDLARRAFRAIPGRLDRDFPAGPWIRLYSDDDATVLNAQLQSAISLADYAELTHDAAAAGYADRLLETAKAMLPRFDTGHWSRYSLGEEATLHYQDYVVGLLKTLTTRTGDPAWSDAAKRFQLYETQPPALTSPTATRIVYPRPKDGIRDALVVRFWLSKMSKVALVVNGKAVNGYTLRSGWHTIDWTPDLVPGTYEARLVARSLDGNPGTTDVGSFAVERDTIAPTLASAKAGGRVFWRVKDAESACCRIRLQLSGGGKHRTIAPARTNGSARIPAGYWLVTVVARDAAGNRSEQSLGLVVGRS